MPKKKTHEEFIKDLWEKNEHYRNGDFMILDKFISSDKYIIVTTKYGNCLVKPYSLFKNLPTIQSAVDKDDYFKKQMLEKNTQYKSGELKLLGKYIKSKLEIKVEDKYGKCLVKPESLLKNYSPTIERAINKTEYFINQSVGIHSDTCDYTNVNYTNSSTRIILRCRRHNHKFKISPNNHLRGRTCPKCGIDSVKKYNRENPNGWTKTIWRESGEKSNQFDSFKVYIIKCWNPKTGEKFYKIGRTFKKVKYRFSGKNFPYQYSILKIYEGTAEEMYDLENKLQGKNKKHSYKPKLKFGGMYECFSQIN